jgi:hypothetical protein
MSDDRPAILALDRAMEKYGITRDDVRPIIAMKLAVVLDDTRDPQDDWCTCNPNHECEGHRA